MSNSIKEKIVKDIIAIPNFLGNYEEHDNILTFLSKIWKLKDLPSEDSRYTNAYDDTFQHIVRNDDWTLEELFINRFNIIDGDEKHFILFLETIVHPTVRKDKDDILFFLSKINHLIKPLNNQLILISYFEDLPVYKYRESSNLTDLPIDIISNQIPIYTESFRGQQKYPHFKLDKITWDDYGCKTKFYLYYHIDTTNFSKIGVVKIMKKDTLITSDVIENNFTALNSDFCSLGQDKSYYFNLNSLLKDKYSSFLLALRDLASFPKIHDQFENDPIFKRSIIRENDVERLARTIRFEIEGIGYNEYYKFQYTTIPPYATNEITLNFDFDYGSAFEHRMFALIGKNGTGKTRILSSLALELSRKNSKKFTPRKPIHGKIFTLSYSFFDTFEIPSRDASFNFVYCGLKNKDGSLISEENLLSNFYRSAEIIKEKNLEYDWYKILSHFIVKDILDLTFEIDLDFESYSFQESKFHNIRKELSSGQSIVIFMISQILSQIRYDSLILFDEPETHLHPNAISALLNTLFELLKRFQSFCVIATHSPIVIQEIPARNIFVIERENDISYIRQLERESFGENLTVITEEIFGNKEIPKHFIKLIKRLISKKLNYEEIVSLLQSYDLPLSSNIQLYIKALLSTNR